MAVRADFVFNGMMASIAVFLRDVWPIFAALIVAPIAWLITEFIGRPLRNFFDLRLETKRLMLLLWDAPEYSHGFLSPDERREQMYKLKSKRDRLTEIAAEFSAIAQAENLSARALRRQGYDIAAAGRAAKTLAFELGTDIEDREKNYRKLDSALRFRFDPKRPFYDPYHPGPWKPAKRRKS
jgi:hypothetical protein